MNGWSFRPAYSCAGGGLRKLDGTTPAFRSLLSAIFVPFVDCSLQAAGLLLTCSPRLENFTRLQPMRSFHVVYVIFFALLGGLAGGVCLKTSIWRWLIVFLPLAGRFYSLQRSRFPNSAHVEWPGMFIRTTGIPRFPRFVCNVRKDAVFALNPNYMQLAGRRPAWVSGGGRKERLADAVKDSGAVSLFPQLADNWKSQVQAQNGWERFKRRDFEHLAKLYPVTWI